MARDFFPRRDAEVGPWTRNFATLIQEHFLALGLTEAQCDAYIVVQQAFDVAMQRVNNHGTNSTSAVVAKNTLRVELESADAIARPNYSCKSECRFNDDA